MLTQYIVALCCLRNNPDAVEVTIGDMVEDVAAEKARDVDVTVEYVDAAGNTSVFKAVEVKNESKPLDVVVVEQLCMKMADMNKVTNKAIFSASGYTDSAKKKAAAHKVDLYAMKKWDTPIGNDFPDFDKVGRPSEFLASVESKLLYWAEFSFYLTISSGPESFSVNKDTDLYNSDGKNHVRFAKFSQYIDAILMRSTGILCTLNPAVSILRAFPCGLVSPEADYMAGPAWPHSHTLDLGEDAAWLKFPDVGLKKVERITITGHLQWRTRSMTPQFYIFSKESDGSAFAGAAITEWGADDGRFAAFVFPEKGRTMGVHRFQITEKQKNIIKNLKIKVRP